MTNIFYIFLYDNLFYAYFMNKNMILYKFHVFIFITALSNKRNLIIKKINYACHLSNFNTVQCVEISMEND